MSRKPVFLVMIAFSLFLLVSSIPSAMANDQCSFDNYRVSQSVVDRAVDYSGSGAVDSTSFTVYALDNDGIIGSGTSNENAISSVTVKIKDNNGNLLASSTNFDNAYLGDNVCLFENFVWNPSNSITDENLGQTTVRVEVLDNAGYQDNLTYTTENAPIVADSISSIYSVSENLVDRDNDPGKFDPIDNTNIIMEFSSVGVKARPNNVSVSVRDNTDTVDLDFWTVGQYENVDENTTRFKLSYNPSDGIPDSALGPFDLKMDASWNLDSPQEPFTGAGENVIKVDDIILGDMFTSMVTDTVRSITVSGTGHRLAGNVTLDNVLIYDGSIGGYVQASFGDNPYGTTYKTGGDVGKTYTVRPELLDKGSRLDGSMATTYTVYTNYGPPIDFDSNAWIKTTTNNVYWNLTELSNPVNYVGISTAEDKITLRNDNFDAGETYDIYVRVTPSEKTVDVHVLNINPDADEGCTALKMKMKDVATDQSVNLSVGGLLGKTDYVLFEGEGTKIDQEKTDSSGFVSFEISDVSSVYKVVREETGQTQPPFNPSKKKLNIDLQIGLYQGKEPTKGGKIQFEPSSEFRPGDKVTVVAYLTADGMEVSHADITGWLPTSWSKSFFAMKDKYGNKFVGTFTVPEDVRQGSYLVSIDASARNLQSTASKTVTVKGAKKGISPIGLLKDYWWIVAIIIILLLLIALS